jgi:hypothetical protein
VGDKTHHKSLSALAPLDLSLIRLKISFCYWPTFLLKSILMASKVSATTALDDQTLYGANGSLYEFPSSHNIDFIYLTCHIFLSLYSMDLLKFALTFSVSTLTQ